MNKKAQGMSLTTIILIVLGLVVLVFLIYGFSTGWKNLWDTITAYTGGGANVDVIKQACVLACSTNSKDAYCNQLRTVKFGDGHTYLGACQNMTSTVTLKEGTKDETIKTIGVESCPSITC